MIKDWLKKRQYKKKLLDEALRLVEIQEKRRKAYEELVNVPLRYEILRDMVNSCLHNVVVETTLADGTKIIIRREEAFDQLQKIRYEETLAPDRRQSW